MIHQGILSGNWNNSVICGSRGSNWSDSPLNLNSNNSARGVTDTVRLCNSRMPNSPLADRFTLSLWQNTQRLLLLDIVKKLNPLAGDF